MVVVNIVISEESKDGNKRGMCIECNLLKREDAKDAEWAIAKAFEAISESTLPILGAVESAVHIDG